jgi:CPA2 family monovalent cation:H+ antiporter-2
VVAQVIPIAGALALGLFVLVLSSALLPSFKVLVVLLVIVGLVAWRLWSSFIKVYSQAQVALQETLAQPVVPRPDHTPAAAYPALLKEADLESITLPPKSPVAGRLIRELELRTRTGASIVGIERTGGANIINPGPEEEVQAGDRVLLLGRHEQLAAARKHLLGES